MTVGRTTTKWIRFGTNVADNSAREIPIDSLSPVGFSYDEVDVTAWQDAVKGYLRNHPDCPIDITGPFDTSALVGLAASATAPTLSGSHTVLAVISAPTFNHPVGLWIAFGTQGYWTTAVDVTFGIIAATPTSGYICTKYVVEGEKYSASFKPYPGTIPLWGNTILGVYTP
jgi:hypothetical protein